MSRHPIDYLLFVLFVLICFEFPAQTALSFKEANKLILEGSMEAGSRAWRGSAEKQSNDAIRDFDLASSRVYWKQELEKDSTNANLNFKVGVCYFFSYDQQLKALPYFKQAVKDLSKTYDFKKQNEKKAPYHTYYFLAEVYLENNQPDSALKYFGIYKDSYQEAPLNVEPGMLMSINAKEGIKNARNVKVENMGEAINTRYAESNPVMRLDNKMLFFSSRRPGVKDTVINPEKLYNADIYISQKDENGKWGKAVAFSYNTDYDEEPLYLSPNGDVLYFRITLGDNSDIYKSEFANNAWALPTPIVELNSPFNETGMSMSADGKYLYFCSDRNRSTSKYDIFKCTKQTNGSWGQLEILSPIINSSFNEVSPFVSPDGKTLFYSSNTDTRKGMGSYDIYYSELKEDSTWTNPKNLGYPINKTRADINYYVSGDDKRYYASLTQENSYDIFSVEGGGFDFKNIAPGTNTVVITNEVAITQIVETEKTKEKEVQVAKAVETIVEKEKEVLVSADDIAVKKEKKAEVDTLKASDVILGKMSRADSLELTSKLKDSLNKDRKLNELVNAAETNTVNNTNEIPAAQALETIVEKEKETDVIKKPQVEKEKEVMVSADDIAVEKEKKAELDTLKVSDASLGKMSRADSLELTDKLKNKLNNDLKTNESVLAAETNTVNLTSKMAVPQTADTTKIVEKDAQVMKAVETAVEKEKEVKVSADTIAVKKEKKAGVDTLKAAEVILGKTSPSDTSGLTNKSKDQLDKVKKANESVLTAGRNTVNKTIETATTQVVETKKVPEKEKKIVLAVDSIVKKEKEAEAIKKPEVEKEKKAKESKNDIAIKKENESKTHTSKPLDVILGKKSHTDTSALTSKLKGNLDKDVKESEPINFKTIYFEFDKSDLTMMYVSELKTLAGYLCKHPETKIEIAGHADIRGAWHENVNLSNKRAREVYDFLAANYISTKRMFFYGKGSTMPAAPNDTEENRSKNRRVEVYILK